MSDMVEMRAALYARVSTEDQAKEGFSIAAQLKRLEAYCKARGWKPVHEYIDDGYSGRDINRPAYRKLMDEKESWDVLAVLKMDRIHRNSKNFTLMMDDLKEWGKEFNSMQENFDTTTAMGRFVMDIVQKIAQLESEQIGERVKLGMTAKAKKGGGPLGSPPPYGFVYNMGSLNIIDEEAIHVRRMFLFYLDGMSLSEIAKTLNSEGIPSKRGGEWSKQAVSKILKNPLYKGKNRWDGIISQGEHPSLVDERTFDLVQKRLSSRVKNRRGSSTDRELAVGDPCG
jgi:DNA invertase Pin-like site-specific DNA recombinase